MDATANCSVVIAASITSAFKTSFRRLISPA